MFGLSFSTLAFAAVDSVTPAPGLMQQGMSLWQLIVAGGSVMIFIGILSVIGVALIIYHWIYIRPDKMTPTDFTEMLLSTLEKGDYQKAASLCNQRPNLVSSIVHQGLRKLSKGKAIVEEAIQHEGKAQISKLWQNLSYLGDIAVLAPMLGLLGTVLGMIQAFNFVAFQAGVVKPVLLAQGLAKAMITTAFGLIVGIPVMAFYAYFRGQIGVITSNAERVSGEVVHLMTREK